MSNTWREYSIFISSTFTDMDAERDIIKFDVINRLNQRYHQQKISFQIIDLRAGINTELIEEQQREEKILDVCFNCIDSARPFFIGLLGNRYGWIPSKEKREGIIEHLPEDKKILLDNCGEISVTEMEILYGAIGHDGENIDHSLFFYRDPECLKAIDLQHRKAYEDPVEVTQTQGTKDKLKKLHTKIKQILCKHYSEKQWIKYQLQYNEVNHAFDGLDKFATLVYDYLVNIIDQEINAPIFKPLRWWEQEQQLNTYIAERMVINTIDRTESVSSTSNALCIIGEPESGKTTLISQLYQEASGKKHIAYVGMTPYAYDLRHIFLRWMCEMGDTSYDQEIPDKKELSDLDVYKKFKSMCASRSDRFFIDNLEALPDNEQSLSAITSATQLCVTASAETYQRMADIHGHIAPLEITPLTAEEKEILIAQHEQHSYFEIPQEIKKEFVHETTAVGKISLTMRLVTGLSAADYQTIRRSGGSIEDINHYLKRLYDASLTAPEGQFYYVVNRFIENVCHAPKMVEVLDYLALSQMGLREIDLENVMGNTWNPIAFALMTNFFSDYFILDPFTKKWNFRSVSLQQTIRKQTSSTEKYAHLAECLMNYPDTDFMKQDLLIYYLIKGHCPSTGKEYLASRKHFHSYDDVREWYKRAVPFLMNDDEFLNDFQICYAQMDDGEAATFLSHFLDYGLKFTQNPDLYIDMVDRYAQHIDITKLTGTQSFVTGWLFIHASMYTRSVITKKNYEIEIRKTLIENGLHCFQRTLELDAENLKAKNMITAAAAELMEIYIQLNDFDKVTQLFEKYNPM